MPTAGQRCCGGRWGYVIPNAGLLPATGPSWNNIRDVPRMLAWDRNRAGHGEGPDASGWGWTPRSPSVSLDSCRRSSKRRRPWPRALAPTAVLLDGRAVSPVTPSSARCSSDLLRSRPKLGKTFRSSSTHASTRPSGLGDMIAGAADGGKLAQFARRTSCCPTRRRLREDFSAPTGHPPAVVLHLRRPGVTPRRSSRPTPAPPRSPSAPPRTPVPAGHRHRGRPWLDRSKAAARARPSSTQELVPHGRPFEFARVAAERWDCAVLSPTAAGRDGGRQGGRRHSQRRSARPSAPHAERGGDFVHPLHPAPPPWQGTGDTSTKATGERFFDIPNDLQHSYLGLIACTPRRALLPAVRAADLTATGPAVRLFKWCTRRAVGHTVLYAIPSLASSSHRLTGATVTT